MGVEPKMRFLSTFNDSELEIVQNTLQSVSCTHKPPCWCLSNQFSSYDSGHPWSGGKLRVERPGNTGCCRKL